MQQDSFGNPVQRTFALKAYEEAQARLYRNEVNAYTAVGNTKSDHIIQYYGSFSQSGKHCLILEYADGKNLDEFFKSTAPPRTPEGILQFWHSFSGYIEGVHRIHQASDGTRGYVQIMGDQSVLIKIGAC
jgi:serine/threonine protein kinase